MYLEAILAHKKEEIKKKKRTRPFVDPPEKRGDLPIRSSPGGNRPVYTRPAGAVFVRRFRPRDRGGCGDKASPEGPSLRAGSGKAAVLYEENGAAAISVLTEEKFFRALP